MGRTPRSYTREHGRQGGVNVIQLDPTKIFRLTNPEFFPIFSASQKTKRTTVLVIPEFAPANIRGDKTFHTRAKKAPPHDSRRLTPPPALCLLACNRLRTCRVRAGVGSTGARESDRPARESREVGAVHKLSARGAHRRIAHARCAAR